MIQPLILFLLSCYLTHQDFGYQKTLINGYVNVELKDLATSITSIYINWDVSTQMYVCVAGCIFLEMQRDHDDDSS